MNVKTIGRNPDNDYVINDLSVNDYHCQFVLYDTGHISVIDFGSETGTYVNGRRISGEVQLNSNDVVQIGKYTISWKNYFKDDLLKEESLSEEQTKERHGFVTFWLWLGIIGNILIVPFSLLTYQGFKSFGIDGMKLIIAGYDLNALVTSINNYVIIMQICVVLSAIVNIIFISYILKWRKFGFWGIVASSIIFGIINIIMMNYIGNEYLNHGLTLYTTQQVIITTIVSMVISSLVLWAILQIKKDGVSCWKNLE